MSQINDTDFPYLLIDASDETLAQRTFRSIPEVLEHIETYLQSNAPSWVPLDRESWTSIASITAPPAAIFLLSVGKEDNYTLTAVTVLSAVCSSAVNHQKQSADPETGRSRLTIVKLAGFGVAGAGTVLLSGIRLAERLLKGLHLPHAVSYMMVANGLQAAAVGHSGPRPSAPITDSDDDDIELGAV